jgi:hypothetical protein
MHAQEIPSARQLAILPLVWSDIDPSKQTHCGFKKHVAD